MDHNDEFLRKSRELYACILASVKDRTMEEADTDAKVMQAEQVLVAALMAEGEDEVAALMAEGEVAAWWRQWGFEVDDTGGGCMALVRDMRGSSITIMLTSEEDPELPARLSDRCTVGWYDGAQDLGRLVCRDSYAALKIVGEKG